MTQGKTSKPIRESQVLQVRLSDTEVGTLTWLPNEQIIFAFSESYMNDSARPTLSLSYKDVLNGLRTGVKPTSVKLPPFFSNLLPEGLLRQYLANKAHVHEAREFFLLNALREDLPGAVVLVPAGKIDAPGGTEPEQRAEDVSPDMLRFSLTGAHLKFSGDLMGTRLVIPTKGTGGHWILKLPSARYEYVNELEYAMLNFAARIGIEVPDVKLIPSAMVEGLPADVPDLLAGNCLASRRFDRTKDGGTVHMEDFAQVFARYDRYDPQLNYQSIANVLFIEIGLDAVLDFVRRLVFMILTGNGDMHLKNWSVIYPDRIHAQLAPAYDYVSTIVYPSVDPRLALKLAGENEFHRITLNTFRNFASIAKLPERAVIRTVNESARQIYELWPEIKELIKETKPDFAERLETHMESLFLLQDIRSAKTRSING